MATEKFRMESAPFGEHWIFLKPNITNWKATKSSCTRERIFETYFQSLVSHLKKFVRHRDPNSFVGPQIQPLKLKPPSQAFQRKLAGCSDHCICPVKNTLALLVNRIPLIDSKPYRWHFLKIDLGTTSRKKLTYSSQNPLKGWSITKHYNINMRLEIN